MEQAVACHGEGSLRIAGPGGAALGFAGERLAVTPAFLRFSFKP
jgi:hypothetical protein